MQLKNQKMLIFYPLMNCKVHYWFKKKKLLQQDNAEFALKVSSDHSSKGDGERGSNNNNRGRGRGYGRGRGRENHGYQQNQHQRNQSQERGRGRGGYQAKSADKTNVECYRCHKYGHYKSECRSNLPNAHGEASNFAEKEGEQVGEISLLMACHERVSTSKNLWYLDTGCSNHMSGDKSVFSILDESFRDNVKFGNNSTVSVMGKGQVTLLTKSNVAQTMSNVLFVPDLKANLLSIGQLQEKGYEVTIKNGVCRILDDRLGLIAQVAMTANRMFPLYLNHSTQSCYAASSIDQVQLWHFRYGHLSLGGLQTLQQKNMVAGLPYFSSPKYVCEECVLSKQHREPFPKGKSERARKLLEIVHSDICGPINPISNRGKRYLITFIDDLSRKT